MYRRLAAGLLWFVAIAVAWDLAWVLAGVPRGMGAILAVMVSTFVLVDPTGAIWSSRTTRRPDRRSAARSAASAVSGD